ncbi:hypothetical protein ABIC07_009066 [Bradyrhizobium sp. RT9a]
MSSSGDLRCRLRLRLPRTVTTPWLGAAMDAKQRGCVIRTESNPELSHRFSNHHAAMLMSPIGSDPSSERLRLSASQLRLPSRTLQRSFQPVLRAFEQPAIERSGSDADALGGGLDHRAIMDGREREQALAPQLVAFTERTLTQIDSRLRKSLDPVAPAPASFRRRSNGRRENDAQPIAHLGGQVRHASEQAIKPWRMQNGDGCRQALREIFKQPGEDQEAAIVRAPHSIILFAEIEVLGNANEQALAILPRDVDPDHAEQHVDQRHCGRPVEGAAARQPCSVQLLARNKDRLKAQCRWRGENSYGAGELQSAFSADGQVDGLTRVQTRNSQHAATRRAMSCQDNTMLRADASPSVHPEQSQIAGPVFGLAPRTDTNTPVTAAPMRAEVIFAADPLRGLIIAGNRPISERHCCKVACADTCLLGDQRQRFGRWTAPPVGIGSRINAKCNAAQRQGRQPQSDAEPRNPGCQRFSVLRNDTQRQETGHCRSWRQCRDRKQIRLQHADARRV